MKRISRGKSVGSVVALNPNKEFHREKYQAGKKNSQDSQQRTLVPKSRTSVELHLEKKQLADYHFMTDGWIASLTTVPYAESPPPAKNLDNVLSYFDQDAVSAGCHVARDSPPLRSDSPARTLPIRTRKSSISSTSTLLEKSNTVPITIIVTTPDEDLSTESEISQVSTLPGPTIRNPSHGSNLSLPSLKPQIMPDRNRLMPPVDTQVDMRKMRKAREFEDIRHFLIGFLNTKGTQLPKNLRTRIMSIYGITDGDLDPKMVAKFAVVGDTVDFDEGVVLDFNLHGPKPTDRDHMRILELAFQSILPTAAPMASQDILAARRKRMSMPLSSYTGTKTMSLHSVDEHSPIASKMSLATNFRSKQTLDSIIANRALLQSTKKPDIAASISEANSIESSTPSYSFFSRKKSVSSRPGKAQSVVNLPRYGTPAATASTPNKRPQSLHRFLTSPSPNLKSLPPVLPPPQIFTPPNLKSRHMKSGSSPVVPAVPVGGHKPAISSKLSLSSMTPTIQEQQPPVLKVYAPRQPSHKPASLVSGVQNSELEQREVICTAESRKQLRPMSLSRSPSTEIPSPRPKSITPPAQVHSRPPKSIPKPITIAHPKDDTVILAPTPISPAHRRTHKALTRSETSDLEKPFYITRRRSSSTLSPVSPVSPVFSSAPETSSSPDGYESDSSGIVFPVHPGFAPLGREKCGASMQVEERRLNMAASKAKKGSKLVTMTVTEKTREAAKLKKEKKDKRTSVFGSFKKSLFGRA